MTALSNTALLVGSSGLVKVVSEDEAVEEASENRSELCVRKENCDARVVDTVGVAVNVTKLVLVLPPVGKLMDVSVVTLPAEVVAVAFSPGVAVIVVSVVLFVPSPMEVAVSVTVLLSPCVTVVSGAVVVVVGPSVMVLFSPGADVIGGRTLVIEQSKPEQDGASELLVMVSVGPKSDVVRESAPVDVAGSSFEVVSVGRIPQSRPEQVVLSDSDEETVLPGRGVSDDAGVSVLDESVGKMPHSRPVQLSDDDEAPASEVVGVGSIPHNNPEHVVEASEDEGLGTVDETGSGLVAEPESEGSTVGTELVDTVEDSDVVGNAQTVSPNKLTDNAPPQLVLPESAGDEPVFVLVVVDSGAAVETWDAALVDWLDAAPDPDSEDTGTSDSEAVVDAVGVTVTQTALRPMPRSDAPIAQDVVGVGSGDVCVATSDVDGETELVGALLEAGGGAEADERDVGVLPDTAESEDDSESVEVEDAVTVESEDDGGVKEDVVVSVADADSLELLGVRLIPRSCPSSPPEKCDQPVSRQKMNE